MAAGIALLTPFAVAGSARAHKNGIAALGCDGCHNGGKPPTVTLTASPESPALGQAVTLTVTVSQTNGPSAGFYLTTSTPVGTFKVIQAGTAASGSGVTHTMPRIGAGGVTAFQAEWSVSQPTGVQFLVFGLSANNDGTSRGDGGGGANLSITSGCAGSTYYLDQDGDGYGTSDPAYPVLRSCALPMGYAAISGDCDDFHASVHPGAPELCDALDNNCDGRIDENLGGQISCEDRDGDGHGVPSGATRTGCAPSSGYGDCGGDCKDADPAVYPGAPELCDGLDNNCDGRVDEGARATCGVGWCRRYAVGCTAQCTPGAPLPETCNLFDDDCDGVVDNGSDLALCGASGLVCVAGVCVPGAPDGGPAGGADAGAEGPFPIADAAVEGGSSRPDTAGRAPPGCTVGTSGSVGDLSGAGSLWMVAALIARRTRRRRGRGSQ